METVTLRTGHTHAAPLVAVVHMLMRSMLDDGEPILFYEAVMLARNPRHRLFGNSGEKLEKRGILESGQMHEATREIIVASVEGDGMGMKLRSPLLSKNDPPAIATTVIGSSDNDDIYRAIGLIRLMAIAYTKEPERELWMELWKNEAPNPYYCQTASGLFLELYYGMPSTLWTPWGKHNLWGSGSGHWDEVAELMVARLGGTLHRPARYEPNYGEIGAVYALSKVDSIPLPVAVVQPRTQFMSYEDSNLDWAAMVSRLGPHQYGD